MGFRYFALDAGQRENLRGYVRNLEDGLDVSLENLRAIAETLGVSAAVLLEALDAERTRRSVGTDL